LALIGWIGTLLVGSQVMKLIIKGIELIYGDQATHSFVGRQLRGLLLFSVTIVAWLVVVELSVFGRPVRQWMTPGFDKSALIRGLWYVTLPILGVILAMLVLALIYRLARPGQRLGAPLCLERLPPRFFAAASTCSLEFTSGR
jgi:uncharacterized BrkB/YihY/UPF0761 family membrane protein